MNPNPPQFDRLLQPYRRAIRRLQLDLEFFLEESGPLLIVAVEQRIKSFDSALVKSRELGIQLSELDDLAGLRIICGTEIDARMIAYFVCDGLRGRSFTTLKDNQIDRTDGYRARHIVIEVPEAYTGTWQPCKVEVQIQTTLQNAFNRLSRAWLYKSGRDLPETVDKKFQLFSHELKRLDRIASELQTEIFENPSENRDEDALTTLGYRAIAAECFGETVHEDNSFWNLLFCRRIGVGTCGELRAFFRRPDIQSFYEECQHPDLHDNPIVSMANSKHEFWINIGSRLPKIREHSESVRDRGVKLSRKDDG